MRQRKQRKKGRNSLQGVPKKEDGICDSIQRDKPNGLFNEEQTYNGSRHILKCMTCRAKPWEILAIVGPSGAGKSSLLEILTGKVTPQSDTIHSNSDTADIINSNSDTPRHQQLQLRHPRHHQLQLRHRCHHQPQLRHRCHHQPQLRRPQNRQLQHHQRHHHQEQAHLGNLSLNFHCSRSSKIPSSIKD